MVGKSKFFRLTKANLKRAFGFRFFISAILVICFMLFDVWGDLEFIVEDPKDMSVWYYYFFSVVMMGTYSSNMFPLLAALPFAANYCEEQQAGVTPLIVSRSSKRSYCISKMLVCTIAGGLALFFGVLLHTVVLSTQLSLCNSEALQQMQGLPYYTALANGTGAGYFLIGAYLAFLRGALYASAAITVSAYITNKYVTIASPFIIHFIAVRLYVILKVPNQARLDLLLRGRTEVHSGATTLILVTVIVIVLIIICGLIFTRKVRRKITYESVS